MPYKQSPQALHQRLARRITLESAYYDQRNCEAVNMLSRADVIGVMNSLPSSGSAFVLAQDEPVQIGSIPDVVKAEILSDSLGQGSFQR